MIKEPIDIRDDRGISHSFRMMDWLESEAGSDPTKRFAIDQAADVAIHGIYRAIWTYGALSVPLLLVLTIVLGFGIQATMLTLLIGSIGVGLGIRLAAPAVVTRRLRRDPTRVTTPMLAQSMCPCCAYDLSTSAPESDGCVACGECGAAWRADRRLNRGGVHTGHVETSWNKFRGFLTLKGMQHGLRILRAKDDAGRSIKLLARRPSERPVRSRHGLDTEAHIMRGGRWVRVVALCFFLYLAGAQWMTSGVFASGSTAVDRLLALFSTVFFSYMLLWIGVACFRGDSGVSARTARRLMLGAALCPACSADLDPAAADDEGLTTCPDCGCRWRCHTPTPASEA
ncbi:MAG: hypothetical protein AAFX05_11025 [Planctomycetota bacterium]